MTFFTKSLKGRFALYFAIAITFSILVSGLISVGLVQRYLRQKTISDLKDQATSLSQQIESEGLPARRYFMDLERVNETRAFILPFNDQGLMGLPGRGQSPDEVEPSARALPFIDWDLLDSGGTQVTETRLPGTETDMVVVAQGLRAGGQLAGAVVLARPLRSLQPLVPLAGWFLVSGAVSLVVSLLMAFVLARRLSEPLHEITEAAEALAEGDFSREVTVRSEDEIGRLAAAFRNMSDEVQKSQEQQRQFVVNVSHELKTPLTSIAGHAQALREGIAETPEDVARSLEVINSETGRLSRLIEDLLSLAKFDTRQFGFKKASVAVDEVVQAVVDGLAHAALWQDIRLLTATVGEPEQLKLNTDPDRLRQILSNLAQNAVAHTLSGGSVTLTSRAREGFIEIQVSDTGEGIPPEDLPYVFDRFYRASSGAHEAGLGLGLSISRELARAMGGDITVSSQPGAGTTFTVVIPV